MSKLNEKIDIFKEIDTLMNSKNEKSKNNSKENKNPTGEKPKYATIQEMLARNNEKT